MMPSEIKALSDRELDAKIAKALGWTEVREYTHEDDIQPEGIILPDSRIPEIFRRMHPMTGWLAKAPGSDHLQNLSLFSTDLNAVHVAEEALTRIQRLDYLDALEELICGEGRKQWPITHASARHRAEALYRVLCENAPKNEADFS